MSRIRRIPAFAQAVAMALVAPGAAMAQDIVEKEVPPATITDLFTFNTPVGTVTDRVVVAKFLVDDVATDLELRLLMPSDLQDFKISDGNVALLDEGTAATMATLRVRDLSATEPTASGSFRLIKVTIEYDNAYDFAASELWTIQAKPTGSTVHFIGFWAEGTGEAAVEAIVTRPRLIDPQDDLTDFESYTPFENPTNLAFGDVHINLSDEYVPDHQWAFVNVGTGPLQITAANPVSAPSGAYDIENYPSPPLTVLPTGTFSRRITVKPQDLGPVPDLTVTLETADPADDIQLNLTNTTGVRLTSAMLLDLSGSMLDDTAGSFTNNPEEQKIRYARLAALELAQLYEAILPDARLSLYSYPNGTGTCPSSQEWIPPDEIRNNIASFYNHLDVGVATNLLTPSSSGPLTPMATGISRVYSELSDRAEYERAAVFHFGDGQHNCNDSGQRPTPAAWYTWETFKNAGIPFYTIPYGATYAGWIDTFQALADNTGGEAYPANVTDDLELQEQFKNALADALDLETLADPTSSVAAGELKEHDVCVDETIRQVVFSVHWRARDENAISLTLRDPSGAIITSSTAATDPNISFVSGETFAGFVVRGARLAGENGAGTWTLRIHGNVATWYSYQVYAQTPTRVGTDFTLPGLLQPGQLTLRVADGARYLGNLDVTAQVSAPAASFNNFLATTYVSRALIDSVPEYIGEGSRALAEKKLYALTHLMDVPLPIERTTQQIDFSRLPGPAPQVRPRTMAAAAPVRSGVSDLAFQASIAEARHAGLYAVEILVNGVTKLGACFQRHIRLSQWVDVALTPELVADAVEWERPRVHEFMDSTVARILATEPPSGFERRIVRFTPRDAEGNYYGIGRADAITFEVSGAETLGEKFDLLDGSYGQLVQFPEGSNPRVRVSVAGIIAPQVSLGSGMIPSGPWLLVLLAIVILVLIAVAWLRHRTATP